MKKIFFIFSIIGLLVLAIGSVFAGIPHATPKCFLEGTIQSVEFKDAYDEPCLTEEEYDCPTDTELKHPARYFLKIKIESVSYVSGRTNYVTCEDILSLNEEHTIFINKNESKLGDSFKSGQKIKGQISSYSRISFDFYELENVSTNDKYIETEDIDSKTVMYVFVIIATIIILSLIIYSLRKNKK